MSYFSRGISVLVLTVLVWFVTPLCSQGQIVLLNPGIEVEYSKLEIDARQAGSKLEVVEVRHDYNLEGRDAVILHAAFGGTRQEEYRKAILETSSFVKDGGRAIVFVTPETIEPFGGDKPPSDFIANEFGIAVTTKDVSLYGEIPKSAMSEWAFSGDKIGCTKYDYEGRYGDAESVGCVTSSTHLVPIDESGIVSQSSASVGNKSLKMYVEKKSGEGRVIVMTALAEEDGHPINNFYNDNNYNLFSNDKVSREMVNWLLGKQ